MSLWAGLRLTGAAVAVAALYLYVVNQGAGVTEGVAQQPHSAPSISSQPVGGVVPPLEPAPSASAGPPSPPPAGTLQAPFVAPDGQPDVPAGVPSPAEANPSLDAAAMAVGYPPSAGVFSTNHDFAPSRERFLDLSAGVYRALELTIEEIQDLDPAFWEANPEYAYILVEKHKRTLRDYLGWIEDPRLALGRAWTDAGTEALWREHQRLFKQLYVGQNAGADLSFTQERLFALRDAIWSGVSPAHQFLFRLDQETR